ncbi:MAG TPA: hypothetical protein VFV69_19925 [Steroidobacteraceae bacterium]|jgi:hypothetical protein|nr:hypothetical protein [Steroidobacteraceae bacterium]
MSTQLTRLVSPNVGFAIAAALTLTACNRGEAPKQEAAAANTATANAEISWARAALERNPDLEVVASDPHSGVVTVKHKSTGEIETVKASEIAAVAPSQLKAMSMRAAPPPEPEPAPTQNESATSPQQAARATAADRSEGSVPVPGATPSGYTVERANGQIRVSGPGVSIVSSGSNASADNQAGGSRRTVDPFICEGRRTLQLDNRDIYVDGDAITVRGGCELFLTNSHIVASGTGIVVQDAVVHISNSHVEGASASFQADDRAKMYVRGSTFSGVPRRTELAMVQDQGGNKWR